jgi:type VI secretion system protein ImpJ
LTKAAGLLKVCSRRYSLELVKRSHPGLALTHLLSPPSVISPRADAHYFALAQEGPCWTDMLKTREVGVYMPDVVTDPKVDVHVIVED